MCVIVISKVDNQCPIHRCGHIDSTTSVIAKLGVLHSTIHCSVTSPYSIRSGSSVVMLQVLEAADWSFLGAIG